MEPFQILGKWDQFNESSDIIIPSSGFSWELRTPYDNMDVVRTIDFVKANRHVCSHGDLVDQWHQDDGGHVPALVFWSNIYPTEVLLPGGTVVRGQPYDVVLVDNRIVQHRLPAEYMQDRRANRFFIRGTRHVVPSNEEIYYWKRKLSYGAA